jgi:putative endonuclease
MKVRGQGYEDRAARWLQDRGLRLLARNYRRKTGEIDIIGQLDDRLVFVEVRARSSIRFAGAAASVDYRKQQRILRTAQLFLQQRPELAAMPCRFDVIAFEPPQSGTKLELRWLQGAFTA